MIWKKYKKKKKKSQPTCALYLGNSKKKKKATTLINKERVNGQFHVKPILSPLFSIVFFLIPNWGKQCFLLKWWAQRENSHNPFPPPLTKHLSLPLSLSLYTFIPNQMDPYWYSSYLNWDCWWVKPQLPKKRNGMAIIDASNKVAEDTMGVWRNPRKKNAT